MFSDGPFEFGCCTLNVPVDTLKVRVTDIITYLLTVGDYDVDNIMIMSNSNACSVPHSKTVS